MKPVREVVSRDVIEDLWGTGYTILPRRRHPDPFYLAPDMIPASRSYQWMHLVSDRVLFAGSDGSYCLGWVPVPASRHDGYFMPAGHVGDIEVNGLGLFEKPRFEVDAEQAKQVAAAHQKVDDWKKRWGGEFSGEVSVGGQKSTVGAASSGGTKTDASKSIETTVAIPGEMIPHVTAIFAERDSLYVDLVDRWNAGKPLNAQQEAIRLRYEEALAENPEIAKGPALNALLLPIAIETVRKTISEEANVQDH